MNTNYMSAQACQVRSAYVSCMYSGIQECGHTQADVGHTGGPTWTIFCAVSMIHVQMSAKLKSVEEVLWEHK